MPNFSRIIFRAVLLVTAYGLTWQAQPASAGCASDYVDQPLLIKATPATKCARYYAPYVLQAAAAYIAVEDFDRTLRNFHVSDNPALRGGEPSLNGDDVERAAQVYEPDVIGHARQYLRAWQYQFGSESYLTCYDTSDANCMKSYNESGVQPLSQGPAFHVWARTHVQKDGDRFVHVQHDACSEVSIAFRGTVGLSGTDWAANVEPAVQFFSSARSFLLRRKYETDTYYHQLRRNIDAIVKRITRLDCYRRAARPPQIVTVGHSLGGGLAQFAALAVTKGARIAKVFTFDSSAVIAGGLIGKDVRNGNADELEIDRVYQSGEGLSKYVNPLVARFQYAGVYSDCGPLIRYVAFDAVRGSGPVELHSVREGAGLAASVVRASYNDQTQLDYKSPKTTSCRTRYHAPASDDDTAPVPSINPAAQTVFAPVGSVVANAASGRRASILSGGEQNITNTNWMWSGDRLVTAPPTAKKGRRVHMAHL
jgi:Lipase (class 3)